MLPRPDPRNEHCPFCNAYNTMMTKASYSAPTGDGTYRNADLIECEACKKGFWVGWISEQPDGVMMQPINGY